MDAMFNIFKSVNGFGTQPQYKGNGKIGGEDVDLAIWVKKTKAGDNYYSIKVSEPYRKKAPVAQPPAPKPVPAAPVIPESDDLPF